MSDTNFIGNENNNAIIIPRRGIKNLFLKYFEKELE